MFGMGFNAHEKALLEQQAAAFAATGLPTGDARRRAKEMLKEAIAQSKAAGHYDAGPMGQTALEFFQTDPGSRDLYEAKKLAGVTDEDILEWWDVDDVERHLMLNYDDQWNMGAMLQAMDEGKTAEEAARYVWKTCVTIGSPLDASPFPDDDSAVPLPPELKLRIMRWRERVMSDGSFEQTKAEFEDFATMNGYIRHLIKTGSL